PLALFICGILSKTIAGSIPIVVLTLLWWKRATLTRRDILRALPFFILAMIAGSVTAWMERHVVRAVGPDWNLSPAQHIVLAGQIAWFYLWKIFVPYPLAFMYHRWTPDSYDFLQWLAPLTIV